MLTLPAEIADNKDKVAIKPVLLIWFVDIGYKVSSRSYSLETGSGSDGTGVGGSGTDFDAASAEFVDWGLLPGDGVTISGVDYTIADIRSNTNLATEETGIPDAGTLAWSADHIFRSFVDNGFSGGLGQAMDLLGGDIGSIDNYTLRLLDWEGTLRENIVGSLPDLRGSDVRVYVKFDVADSTEEADALILFKGQLTDYSVSKDKMTLKFQSTAPVLTDLVPSSLLRATYPGAGDDTVALPVQLGAFDKSLIHWKNSCETYAVCPYVGIDTSGYHRFVVSDHIMNEMPTTTDLIETTSSTDSTGFDPSLMGFINNTFFKVRATAIDSLINTSTDGASFVCQDFDPTDFCFYFYPTTEQTNNTAANWANAIDGDPATNVTANNSTESVMVDGVDSSAQKKDVAAAYAGAGTTQVRVVVSLGAVTIITTDKLYAAVITTTSVVTGFVSGTRLEITNGDADTVVIGPWGTADLDNLGVGVWGEGSDDAASCEVKSVMIQTHLNPNTLMNDDFVANVLNSNPYLFIKAKGKEYSGTWDTRKTAGNLIESPADIIEYILRDEVGSTNTDIDMDSFDAINTLFTSVKIRGTLYSRRRAGNLLRDILQSFSTNLTWNSAEQWRLICPIASGNNFSSSGTGTAGSQDIFTDSDTLTAGVYTNHPIVQRSLNLKRSPGSAAFDMLTINYSNTLENFLSSITSGSGINKTILNRYVADPVSASALVNLLDNIHLSQHWIVKINTWYNALAHEVGDVINVRHSSINDDMLNSTEVAQKWMIYNMGMRWHPAMADIFAIELL